MVDHTATRTAVDVLKGIRGELNTKTEITRSALNLAKRFKPRPNPTIMASLELRLLDASELRASIDGQIAALEAQIQLSKGNAHEC